MSIGAFLGTGRLLRAGRAIARAWRIQIQYAPIYS